VSTSETPDPLTAKDLKSQPLAVLKTELPALAEALGITPAELFRSLTGTTAGRTGNRLMPVELEECCNNDDW
jgi:hypothetical protein